MPANTRTPSHQYGVAGCYGFYEAKLHDLRAYEELHSGVMHNFRRLGNAVLFLELLEGATQVVSMKTLLQLPPSGPDGTEAVQPLCKAADSVARAWGQEPGESDMSLMARQLSAVCAPLAPSASLLNAVLARLASVLAPQKQQWLGGDDPVTDPMPLTCSPMHVPSPQPHACAQPAAPCMCPGYRHGNLRDDPRLPSRVVCRTVSLLHRSTVATWRAAAPCDHLLLQRPTRVPGAALSTREQSPRRLRCRGQAVAALPRLA